MAFEFAQGFTFNFANAQYTATSISVTVGRQEFDISSTDLDSGDYRRLRLGKLESADIKVDWIGGTVPPVKGAHDFTLTSLGGVTGGKAICTGLSITGVAGDLIKGSATFKASRD